MSPNRDDAARIQRVVHMGLHPVIDSDSAVAEDGLGLVAADAVKGLHYKFKQLAGLLYLAHHGFVVVARDSVVVSSVCHNSYIYKVIKDLKVFKVLNVVLIKDVTQTREDAVLVAVAGFDMLAVVLQHADGLFFLVIEFLGNIDHDIDEQVTHAVTVGRGQALAAQAQYAAGLRTGLDGHACLAVDGGHGCQA